MTTASPWRPTKTANLVIQSPWPSMIRTVYGDDKRFISQYWEKYQAQGWYLAGDTARRDEDGYIWVIGRNDDVAESQRLSAGHGRSRIGFGQP